jgi:hypothetical protein
MILSALKVLFQTNITITNYAMTDQTKTQPKLQVQLQLQLQEDWGASEMEDDFDLPPLHESQPEPEQNYSPGNAQDCLPQVTGQTHLKAIHQCNMEMIADNLFGRVVQKAPGQRPCRVREYGMQEYFKNPITGRKVYYSALFEDEGCQPVDYIEQIRRAVVKLSDGKLKLQIEIVQKCKITVTLQYV